MEPRNGTALMVGIVLGAIWCALLTGAGFGAGALLLVALISCPLVASLIARTRLFLFALLPNLIIGCFVSIVGALSPYNRTPNGGFSEETWFIVPIVLAISVGSALLIAAGVWFFRSVRSPT